ncbi:endonuclease domain-containing protein [Streptomyces violascens]|uniref:endonuclease domain-containing protein n=1 Tax=Streptomyces violascens TaxID=67381 RepID=UPI003658DD51
MVAIAKSCTGCGEVKSLDLFANSRTGKYGKTSKCKECKNAVSREWRARNPERARGYHRRWAQDPVRYARRQAAWAATKYGIPATLVVKMWEAPCQICGSVDDEKRCIDHCHVTGKVRGSLCRKCNSGLGQFKDNPALLNEAVAYLEVGM